ncbi:MAG: hypothetical protein IT477_11000, partial [Rhodanobacteraceae bacterium]|nr:hypothetical protein [Rhodanobacteraceae bacterium]
TDYFDGTEWLCLECRNDEQLSPDGYCVCKDGLVRSNPNDPSSPCGKPTKPLTQQPPPEKGRTAGTDNVSPRTTGGKKEEKKGWGWGTWLAVGLGLGAAGLLIYGAAKGMGGKKPDELPPAPPPMRSNPVGEVDDEADAELMGDLFMSVAGQRVLYEQQAHGYGDVQATLLPADSCRRGLCTNDGRPLEGAPDFTPHSVFFVDLEPGKAWPHAAAFVFIPQDNRPSAWLDASLPPLP